MIPFIKSILAVLFLSISFTNSFSQSIIRKIIPLNSNWQFSFVNNIHKQQVNITVSIPHTWNATEVKNPKQNYQRTNGVYRKRIFIDNEWTGKRFFLFFEGANSVANVFVNKKYAGEHRGGYTKFCFEVTSFIHVGDSNDINVMVSNVYRLDVLPMSGDFNVYGGLHRSVSLIVTEKNCISPLYFASPGIFVTPKNISNQSADVDIKTILSIKDKSAALRLRTTILNEQSEIISQKTSAVTTPEIVVMHTLKNPHLWNGKADPYLYSVQVELLQNGKIIDMVTQNFGVRTFKVNANTGFYLNGKPYDLHGVCFHEDVEGKGSAYRQTDYENDQQLLNELGVTAVRMAHYPHGQPAYDLADKNGIIVWTEIPLIGSGGFVGEGYVNSKELHQHAETMLTELIRQNYNHPGICFWGLFNELTSNFDNPAPFIKNLQSLAQAEDSTRLTTCADMLDHSPFDSVSNVKAWNKYFGWYSGNVNDIGPWFDRMHQRLPNLPIGISEYGAGASIHQHTDSLVQPVANSKFHPEEWQTFFHENYWQQLSSRAYLWGKFIWVFADFGSTGRNEGDTVGINDKGLLTYDRKIKKDAFYFYKANWNTKEPTLYIAERRDSVRYKKTITVAVFSNLQNVELIVNGKSAGKKSPDPLKRLMWQNILLEKGKNIVETKAWNGETEMKDRCVWELKE